jgi:hypothetical protein
MPAMPPARPARENDSAPPSKRGVGSAAGTLEAAKTAALFETRAEF